MTLQISVQCHKVAVHFRKKTSFNCQN